MPRRTNSEGGRLTDQAIDIDDFRSRLGLGGKAQAIELLRLFQTSAAARMAAILAAVEGQDRTKLRIEAHALKGAARNASASALAGAMADIEASSESADWRHLAELATMGAEALAAVNRFVEAWKVDEGS